MKVGHTVQWIGAGKLARLEGMQGKLCTGTIVKCEEFEGKRAVTVMPSHRTRPGATFHNLQALILVADLVSP